MEFPIGECSASQLKIAAVEEVYPKVKRLFFRGSIAALERKRIAIVGARRASHYGRRAAVQFAKDLAAQGVCVISGLARGVDGAAHYGSLLGGAPTVAILGSGLNHIYPREHFGLAHSILKAGGLLLSEYEPSTPPDGYRFPMRNRIIAALSEGVLVIQAREKSGSLITAKCALDLGRDVFVLPGPYDDPSFIGAHTLVQEGAKLVRSANDILSDLPKERAEAFSFWPSLFQRHGGTMTLEEIFSATHLPLSEIIEAMETKKAAGEVVEFFPQQYSHINQRF